ncbi:ATP-dependent nuclease [Streptomyces ochraceiscleroticus]|uniref:ATP-dependent endonuclease n=1 Tax=Streptomyces ochraceiscleroticus TaxID=47761 RepID=A0ABW1MMV5_9ACTN|nr:AAA family ATPase [Streptomyces ochraceiscleroticus]
MQLSRVRVRNYRNFKDLTIDPFPSPAVIVGENGIGKSNLLQALRLILDPDLLDRHRVLGADDIHDHGPTLAEGVEVSVEIDLSGFDEDLDARSVLDGAVVSLDPLTARLTYLFRPRKRALEAAGADDADAVPASGDQPDEGTQAGARALTAADYEWTIFGSTDPGNSMRDVKRYAAFSVLPALRDTEKDLARSDRSPLTRLLRELPPTQDNLDATLKAMKQARARLAHDTNVQHLTDALARRITALAGPRLGITPSLDFAGREEDLLRSVQLYIDAARTRSVDRSSTGMANVLYLALLLERLELRRRTPEGEDTLLAVEEPEAHLHPTLQRHLFFHLLRHLDRLMLTTHSPHIAAVTPLTSLVLMYEEDGAVQARAVPPALLEERERKDLERYLNVSRAEILFARGIILVEGIAEAYLVPALAKAAGLELDAHGIVVASVEGTAFGPYARLLGPEGLNRLFWILTDGDQTDLDLQRFPHLREGGLTRAADVLDVLAPHPATAFRRTLESMRGLPLPEDGSPRAGRPSLVSTAAQHRVFVGEHTLEVDLAPLLRGEMQSAFDELVPGAVARSNFADAVKGALGTTTADQRLAVLSRIEKEEVSKGRYAQRLAAHVEAVEDLPARIRRLAGSPSDAPLSESDLLQLGRCGALLALINQLCQLCLDRPLVAKLEPDGPQSADAPVGA